MYIKKTYRYGSYVEVHKYYPTRTAAGGRAKKAKRTKEEVDLNNQKTKERKLQRLILGNFKKGDWHLTLTYEKSKRPGSLQEAKEIMQKFCRKLKTELRKLGHELKYIYVTERGKLGACHHHMILEDLPGMKDLIMRFWVYGSHYFSPIYEDGECEQLASYLLKHETKEENAGSTYTRSRNLVTPAVEKEIIYAHRWALDPKELKGYQIIKDSVVNGYNVCTGMPMQRYMMRKDTDDKYSGRRKVRIP